MDGVVAVAPLDARQDEPAARPLREARPSRRCDAAWAGALVRVSASRLTAARRGPYWTHDRASSSSSRTASSSRSRRSPSARCTSRAPWRPPAARPASSTRASTGGPSRRCAPSCADWRPDVVGLSLRNADNAAWPYTNTYTDWYARVADAVRAGRAAGAARPRRPGLLDLPARDPPRAARRATASSATARWRRGGWSRAGLPAASSRSRSTTSATSASPATSAAVVPRRRTLPHRRRADGARLPAPLRLLHVPAARGHAPAAAPSRGRRRRDGTAAPGARHHRAVRGRLVVQRRRGPHDGGLRGAAPAAEPARRAARGRLLLLLPAAARERPGRVPAAARGRLHLGGLRHRHGRRGAAARASASRSPSRTCARRRPRPRRPASTCATRCSSAVRARRRRPWPRRCA